MDTQFYSLEMSRKAIKQPSLKSIEKDCSNLRLEKQNQILIVTSPFPDAMSACGILSRAIAKSDKVFHISFAQPAMSIDRLNDLRQKFNSSAIFLIGLDILGSAHIKKGSSYPILIGGVSESEQAKSLTIGTDDTLSATTYILSKIYTEPTEYDLQLAATGALLSDTIDKTDKGANREIIELASSAKLVEERKGFKLFGVNLLPLDEVFLYSTHPYLNNLSGNQKACDTLLNEAEIPLPKLRTSLTNLSTSEAQNLTSNLVTRLRPDILPRLLGTDYEFTHERDTSPMRHLSNIEIIGLTAWAINELGAYMSILLGDRARAMRLLVDSHMSHHKSVISLVQKLEVGLKSESTTSATFLKIDNSKNELLPDTGRISLETGMVDTNRLVVFDNGEAHTIIWPFKHLNAKDVYRKANLEGIDLITTSRQSIRVQGILEEREKMLQLITEINEDS